MIRNIASGAAALPFLAVLVAGPVTEDDCILHLAKAPGPVVLYYGTCAGTCINRTCLTKTDPDDAGSITYSCVCREALQGGGFEDHEPRVDCKAKLTIYLHEGEWVVMQDCVKKNCTTSCQANLEAPPFAGSVRACLCPGE